MADFSLCVTDFLQLPGAILDVRSPGEYLHARIPGAVSLPLFSDSERAVVGTLYKQKGKDPAVLEGLRIAGPKLAGFVESAREAVGSGHAKVHCWRGGMRSGSMAWLLKSAGLPTATLSGGYKAFRNWVLKTLQAPRRLIVVGGLTGSGKTAILHALQRQGEQTLDLEQLAGHRGSSYGMLGMTPQQSSEQFENEIALQWHRFDPNRPVWIEDESRLVGTCKIPDAIFTGMQKAPLYLVERPQQERLATLKKDYGCFTPADLKMATERISRRLGGARTQQVIALIDSGHWRDAAELVLQYYDTAYSHTLVKRQRQAVPVCVAGLDDDKWAELLIETHKKR